MKMLSSLPAPRGYVAGKVHALIRYLERLADGWECARDEDIAVIDGMLNGLDCELRYVGEERLPSGCRDLLETAHHAVDRARASRADARMRHLEAAEESAHALLSRLPAHL